LIINELNFDAAARVTHIVYEVKGTPRRNHSREPERDRRRYRDMEQTADIDIRLSRIRELHSLSTFNRWEFIKYSGGAVDVDIHSQLIPYPDQNVLNLILGVTYTTTRNMLRRTLLRYDIELSFEIKHLASVIGIADKSVYVPPTLTATILSVGIGALRGMLAMHTQRTFLSRYPLPIFNMTDMISRLANDDSTVSTENPLLSMAYE